jgi:hypothetical protein
MKKQLLYFFLAIVVIATAVLVVQNKSYPVASVNGRMVTAEHYSVALDSGRAFYGKDPELAEKLSTEPGFQAEFESELKRATLDAIIKYEISRDELVTMLGQAAAQEEVAKKVAEVEESKTENTDTAVAELFGIDWPSYKLIVVEPEAYKTVLREEVEGRSLNFDLWFNDKLESAEIEIFLSGFEWSGTEVEFN